MQYFVCTTCSKNPVCESNFWVWKTSESVGKDLGSIPVNECDVSKGYTLLPLANKRVLRVTSHQGMLEVDMALGGGGGGGVEHYKSKPRIC